MCLKAEQKNLLFGNAQHLHHLNSLIDTIKSMVTSTGQCNRTGLQVTNKYWEHIHVRVINVNGTTVMWDIPVITD
jgi:hypothetical protein